MKSNERSKFDLLMNKYFTWVEESFIGTIVHALVYSALYGVGFLIGILLSLKICGK